MTVLGLRFCARAFSSCGERGPLFIAVRGPLTVAASLVAEHRLQTCRLSSCGSRAQLLCGMWDLPRPGLEPVSPALAGRLSTTAPPGKPQDYFSFKFCEGCAHGSQEEWCSLSDLQIWLTGSKECQGVCSLNLYAQHHVCCSETEISVITRLLPLKLCCRLAYPGGCPLEWQARNFIVKTMTGSPCLLALKMSSFAMRMGCFSLVSIPMKSLSYTWLLMAVTLQNPWPEWCNDL